MRRDNEAVGNRTVLALVITTTVLSIVASLIFLSSGYYIIFQNLFYIPIILACIFWLRRGLVFSILLSLLYLILLFAFAGFGELGNGIIRTVIFITIASLVTVIAERNKEANRKIIEKNQELAKANEKLKKSRYRYHMLFENTGDPIFLHRIEKNGMPGKSLEVNTRACEILGYTHDELCRLSVTDLVEDKAKREIKEQAELLYQKGNHTFESSMLTSNGTTIPIEINSHIIQNGENEELVLSVVRDITARKEAEEALRKSEEQYRTIYDDSPIAIELYDTNGYLIHVNYSCLRLFGVENVDFLKGFFLFADPNVDDEQKVKLTRGETIRYESEFDFEKVRELNLYPTSRRGTIWINVLITPLKTSPDSISGYLVQVQDITDRNLMAEELRRSEVKYRDLADNAQVGILTCDRNGRSTYVNSRVPEILGSPSIEDTMGINLLESETLRKEGFDDILMDVFEKGAEYPELEIKYTSKWGKTVYLRLHISPILKEGRPDGARFIIDDITRKKEMEEALRESEGRLRTLIQTIPDLVWLKDEYGVYLACNAMFERFFGEKEDEIKGKTDYDFVDKELADFFRENDRRAVDAGKPVINEEWITFAVDGQYALLETIKTPIYNSEGDVIGVLGIGRDITERKKSEDALKTVNKKLNLLSNITRHDIINQVMGAEMILEMMETDDEITQNQKITKNIEIVSNALQTIERQIIFTRDYQDLGIKSANWQKVGEIIDRTAASVETGVKIINEVGNLSLFADPLFEKVIFNLIDNAVRHGEKITTIRFYSEKTVDGLKLICEDDGVGVSEDVKEKIFNRQYFKHTGLGLFLSREILSITGMEIAEAGVPGEGARFEIHVPEGKFRG